MRLVCYAYEERSHGGERVRLLLKPRKLRVMAVPLGGAGKDLLSEKCFSPGCDQALGIEVARMECP